MAFRWIVFCAVLALAGAQPSPSRAQNASPEGYWVTRGFVVHVAPCRSGLCGTLVGLDQRPGLDSDRLDGRNSDLEQRGRVLCGIPLLGNFKPSAREPGKWEGGWIYNPEDGRTYKSEMRLTDANTFKARGYVLVRVLGRDLTLTRESPLADAVYNPQVRDGLRRTHAGARSCPWSGLRSHRIFLTFSSRRSTDRAAS